MPRTSKQLILYFDSVFGKSSCEGVLHGGQGWFIDQGMISRRIQEWKIEKVINYRQRKSLVRSRDLIIC